MSSCDILTTGSFFSCKGRVMGRVMGGWGSRWGSSMAGRKVEGAAGTLRFVAS